MGLLLVAAVVGSLALHGDARTLVVDGLGILVVWVSAAVCWLAVWRVGFRRWDVLLAAAAVVAQAAGLTYLGVVVAGGGSVPLPSPADAVFLLFYPLMLAALLVAMRRHVRGLASSLWLDCAVGSLGAASVLAVVLSPVLDSALAGSSSLATAVAVAYPMFDLLLVAAVAGIVALGGVRVGSRWVLLAAGLMAFAAADVVYALRVTSDLYVVGSPLDAGWALGLALMAMWVDAVAQDDGLATRETGSTTGATALSTLAVVLAGVTLVLAAARTQLAFRQLARMADLRHRAATTDELTGLPNRRALYAEAQARLVEPQRWRLALLMLDLDRFKEVNDSLGHHAGDLLLIQVGARLSEHLRAGDVLTRLGGDEFAVLLEDVGRDEAAAVAVKLRAALAEPFALEGIALHSSVSVGIALSPDDGPDLSSLLRKADIAMYRAKTSGDGHHVYSIADDAHDGTRLRTVGELRTALAEDQLVVHYQPKIDLLTGEVRGVEALVRWDHPTRGLLYPDAFLDLVQEAGLMRAMTTVVLDLALDQIAAWQAQGQQLTVAVNISASSLVDADLPEQVAGMLAARGLEPRSLQLEITEEFLMADRDRARAILTRLRHSGVQISVDDFGTGYSSLSYLRDLPIDELKLDRSFIFPMADDARAAALVASTIDLAHSLGLRMVAEGVETDVAYTELTRLGCDQAQGYFMSRPVPAAELDHWLSARRATAKLIDLPNRGPLRPSGRH
ncbi:bifunctional diguanylate cyclase/phosphodiesterase [Cellulomonas sp. KRMCY2]|uniref:putative bifunctional diguanylate cyclase/phosphodiesterase n=1 Tax=Cellulomonas sp. KRMCY2 TaxID=1304865 RepID=UPI00045EB0BA|nr:EAL domain-containing protein [Cellulomonas sp. KRMCY2]